MSDPRHLLDTWEEIAPRLSQPRRVALFSDFDGTLAPISRHPDTVQIAPGMPQLLTALVKAGALVGVISGRSLADVSARVGVRGLWYAGTHGHFLRSPGNRRFELLNARERAKIANVYRCLSRTLASQPQILLENKSASVAVHYRCATRGARQRAREAVQAVLAGEPGLRLFSGKKIWEVVAGGTVDKWTAVRYILRRHRPRPRTMVFLGDDLSDECVFEQMRGISILVGRKHHTAARFWLRSPAEVRRFLEQCLRLWE